MSFSDHVSPVSPVSPVPPIQPVSSQQHSPGERQGPKLSFTTTRIINEHSFTFTIRARTQDRLTKLINKVERLAKETRTFQGLVTTFELDKDKNEDDSTQSLKWTKKGSKGKFTATKRNKTQEQWDYDNGTKKLTPPTPSLPSGKVDLPSNTLRQKNAIISQIFKETLFAEDSNDSSPRFAPASATAVATAAPIAVAAAPSEPSHVSSPSSPPASPLASTASPAPAPAAPIPIIVVPSNKATTTSVVTPAAATAATPPPLALATTAASTVPAHALPPTSDHGARSTAAPEENPLSSQPPSMSRSASMAQTAVEPESGASHEPGTLTSPSGTHHLSVVHGSPPTYLARAAGFNPTQQQESQDQAVQDQAVTVEFQRIMMPPLGFDPDSASLDSLGSGSIDLSSLQRSLTEREQELKEQETKERRPIMEPETKLQEEERLAREATANAAAAASLQSLDTDSTTSTPPSPLLTELRKYIPIRNQPGRSLDLRLVKEQGTWVFKTLNPPRMNLRGTVKSKEFTLAVMFALRLIYELRLNKDERTGDFSYLFKNELTADRIRRMLADNPNGKMPLLSDELIAIPTDIKTIALSLYPNLEMNPDSKEIFDLFSDISLAEFRLSNPPTRKERNDEKTTFLGRSRGMLVDLITHAKSVTMDNLAVDWNRNGLPHVEIKDHLPHSRKPSGSQKTFQEIANYLILMAEFVEEDIRNPEILKLANPTTREEKLKSQQKMDTLAIKTLVAQATKLPQNLFPDNLKREAAESKQLEIRRREHFSTSKLYKLLMLTNQGVSADFLTPMLTTVVKPDVNNPFPFINVKSKWSSITFHLPNPDNGIIRITQSYQCLDSTDPENEKEFWEFRSEIFIHIKPNMEIKPEDITVSIYPKIGKNVKYRKLILNSLEQASDSISELT